MATYECECGLIISTSSSNPQCLRCRKVLGVASRLRRVNTAASKDTVVMTLEREAHYRNATPPNRAGEQLFKRQNVGR